MRQAGKSEHRPWPSYPSSLSPAVPLVLAVLLLALPIMAVHALAPSDPPKPEPAAGPLSIEQTALGGVFVQGEDPAFVVTTSAEEVGWSVRDYWGGRVAAGREAVGGDTTRVRVPLNRTGYFELKVTAETGDSARTSFAVIPQPAGRADDGFTFGAQSSFGQGLDPELVSLLAKMGAESVRDTVSWAEIEAEKGVYDFSASNGRYETYLTELHEYGIEPLIHVGLSNPHYDNDATPHSEEGQAAFGRFVAEVVRHFGEQAGPVTVYNEPNLPKFGDHGDGPADATSENYNALLRATYEAVKEVSPDALVSGPELAAGHENTRVWRPWLERFFASGGLDHLDAVSLHPYRDRCCAPEGLSEDLDHVTTLMERYGDPDRPVWITEQGWSTELVTEEEQAAYVLRTYVTAIAAGVERLNWFSLVDQNGKEFGLLRAGYDELGRYAPKPSYVSYAVMTNRLSGLAHQGFDDAPAGVLSHRFGAPGRPTTRVMWSPVEEKQDVTMRAEQPLQVTDLMGVTRTLSPVQGQVSLTLTADPVYVRGDIEAIEGGAWFGIRAEDSAVSEDVPATLRLDNRGTEPMSARFSFGRKDFQVSAAAGEIVERPVVVNSGAATGRRVVNAEVWVGGRRAGIVSETVEILPNVTMRVTPEVADVKAHQARLGVEVTNNRRKTATQVANVDWSAAGESGTVQPNLTVDPGRTQVIPIPLEAETEFWTFRDSTVTVTLAEGGTLRFDGRTAFNPVVRQEMPVDGEVADLESAPRLNLAEHGEVKRTEIGVPYEGTGDLSGRSWVVAGEETLNLAVEVTDDAYHRNESGSATWLGDGVQIGLARGLPGETTDFYEYVVGLTPEGPEVRRAYAPPGETTGLTDDQVVVVRDEENDVTTYEIAIPWAELEQIDPDDGIFSLSMVVNDNDGGGREGWVEWGSGIASGKDPAAYHPMTISSG